MPEWLEKVLITVAMVCGLISMLINNIGGAWVIFTFVLIYQIIVSVDAIQDELMYQKMLKEYKKNFPHIQKEQWEELCEVSKAVAEKILPPTEEKRSVEDER